MAATRQSPPATDTDRSPDSVCRRATYADHSTDRLAGCSPRTLYGVSTTVGAHAMEYLLSPGVLLARLVSAALLFRLARRGATLGQLLWSAALLEALTFTLWLLLPTYLATVLALYGSFHLYGRLYDRRVTATDNARLIADDDISSLIREISPGLNFECVPDGERFRISTFLRYVLNSRRPWVPGDRSGDDSQDIHLSEVRTVLSGYDYDVARVIRSMGVNSRLCFHVTLDDDKTTVTFVARDPQTRDQWLSVFRLFCTKVENVKALWLERSCKRAGVSAPNGSLQLEQLEAVMTGAGRPIDRSYLTELIKVECRSANSGKKSSVKSQSKSGQTDQAAGDNVLEKLFDAATFRPEIEIVFEKLVKEQNDESLIDASGFRRFLKEYQQEDVDVKEAKRLIREHETLSPTSKLTSVGFTSYMISERNSIFNYKYRKVYQDMTKPLNHYFISTSHNTYLTKDQLKSKSSVEMYANALKRGCRCVELDTWDGGSNEPVIYHGRTFTSKILLKDVIAAVRDHAFSTSEYPVILSFENHCSVEQQKVIASHLTTILGDKLYRKPIPEDEKHYPSPDDLRGYVIVKYKKLKTDQDLAYDLEESSDEELSDEESNDEPSDDEKNENDDEARKRGSVKSIIGVMKSIKGKKSEKKKEDIPKIAQELSDLVIYCQSVRFKGFEIAKEKHQFYEMSSIGEKKAIKLLKDEPLAFLDYNTRQMCRTYPAGNRIDSSNYDPHQLWNVGAQMVALNFQTHDRPMQLYQGMFQDNGSCGYILKPEFLRRSDSGFDPRGPFNSYRPLDVQIISGHQLPYTSEKHIKSDRGLSVTVRLSGVEADLAKDKTKFVKSNGFHVVWNETLRFKVYVPELAMIQFTVRENDIFLGQYALPIRCMQQGYRNVPLYSKSSTIIPYASLFVHVHLGDESPAN